jgi:excisionase family DNA binding protein
MATQAPPESPLMIVLADEDESFLTVDDVAERVNVSRATVRREISRGNLQAVRIGSRLRVRPDDFRRWVEGGIE